MRVFIISSDKTLVGAPGIGDAVSRHAGYGREVESIDILVYTNKKEDFKIFPISEKIKSIPSNSFSKLTFFFSALKIFREVNKEHKIDLIVSQDPFVFGLAGWWLKRKYKTKLIINFHGDFWGNKFWLRERFLNHIFLLISYFTVQRADALKVENYSIKGKLVKKGISENKIAVIPTPVDSSNFEALKNQESLKTKKSVLFVGRLYKVKNISFLIRAFSLVTKEMDDAELVLVGDGPERKNISQLVKKLNLEKKVKILGHIDHKELPKYYQAASMLVITSFSEGIPKVLIEGGLSGLPLLAPDALWSREVIEGGQNGFLVPLNDERALAKKIILLLQDEQLRMEMSQISRNMAEEYVKKSKGKLVEFWYKVLGSGIEL